MDKLLITGCDQYAFIKCDCFLVDKWFFYSHKIIQKKQLAKRVLQKTSFEKFCKIHSKTTVSEPVFNKASDCSPGRCFSATFTKLFRTAFLQNIFGNCFHISGLNWTYIKRLYDVKTFAKFTGKRLVKLQT